VANAVAFDYYTEFAGTIELPGSRGAFSSAGLVLFQRQSLPTDPIGTFALTLTGLIPGSAVQVESGSTVFHFSIAASDTLLINLQAYAAGSPLNALTIKVRKGSEAPYYQPYRTQTTAIVGAQSIFVSQIEDQ